MYGKESYNTIGKGGAEELERMEKIRWIIKKEFEREREIKEKEIKTIQKSIEQAKTILEIIESSMNREDTSDGEQDSFEDSEDESLEYEEEENGYYPTGGSSFESGKKGGYVGDTSYGNYDSTGMGVFEYLRNGVGDGGSTKPVKSKKKIIIKDEDEDEDENKDEGVSEVQLSKPVESKSGKLYVFEDDTGERVEVRCNRCYKEDFGDIEDFMKHSDKVHGVKYNDKQEVINECGIYEVMYLEGRGIKKKEVEGIVDIIEKKRKKKKRRKPGRKRVQRIKEEDEEEFGTKRIKLQRASVKFEQNESDEYVGSSVREDEEKGKVYKESRFHVIHRVIMGNSSQYIPVNQRTSGREECTHRWKMYVKEATRDAVRMPKYIRKIKYKLHPSYKPRDEVEIRQAPYEIERYGWGEFPVGVEIYFKDARNKPIRLVHMLKLEYPSANTKKADPFAVAEDEACIVISGKSEQPIDLEILKRENQKVGKANKPNGSKSGQVQNVQNMQNNYEERDQEKEVEIEIEREKEKEKEKEKKEKEEEKEKEISGNWYTELLNKQKNSNSGGFGDRNGQLRHGEPVVVVKNNDEIDIQEDELDITGLVMDEMEYRYYRAKTAKYKFIDLDKWIMCG